VSGGKTPVIGFHSVMLNPDSVRRVTAPTTMTPSTRVLQPSSQKPTARGASVGRAALVVADVVVGVSPTKELEDGRVAAAYAVRRVKKEGEMRFPTRLAETDEREGADESAEYERVHAEHFTLAASAVRENDKYDLAVAVADGARRVQPARANAASMIGVAGKDASRMSKSASARAK
jgi:hypothetical protein